MAIEEFIARKINLDGSTGTSKATIENHVVTYENSESPSPYITEIKTLNGVSLVGSGNYDFDTALNEASTNAVQNKVITEYIYDLESKVSTLAVKVYNHDIALGTLNIENVLYSVENADSFAIPTTIGTNADVVIPKSRMALNMIKGKTEYSRNLWSYGDAVSTNPNFNYEGPKGNRRYIIRIPVVSGQNYCLSYVSNNTNKVNVYDENDRTNLGQNLNSNIGNNTLLFTATNSSYVNIRLYFMDDSSLENCKFTNIMLVKGSTAPTTFVPYYTGLKNVELNSLNVYGESDEYTSLNANDKVSAIRYFYPTTTQRFDSAAKLVDKNGNVVYTVQVYANHETLGTFTKIWRGNYDTMLINANTAGINGVYKLDGVYKVLYSDNGISYGALNATSVKSILPSSILPKTLPAYERLEVVDNGDDTYKIDLVSHAELHVGDEINSLWVGNPQAGYEAIPSEQSTWVYFNNQIGIRDSIADWASSYYNRYIIHDNIKPFISNISSLCLVDTHVLIGGSDTFVSGTNTNRNVVVNFSEQIEVTAFPTWSDASKKWFRNGEETRTTLIDGLSLDDVSAIIDTNDVVYADNSNAEYDVSIAETSVELLANKTN